MDIKQWMAEYTGMTSCEGLNPGTKEFNDALREDYRKVIRDTNKAPASIKHIYTCPLCKDTGYLWEIEDCANVPQLVAAKCSCGNAYVNGRIVSRKAIE